jgi:hypothetical protein
VNHIRYVRSTASIVVAVCSTLFGVVLLAASASATVMPGPGGGPLAVPPRPHPIVAHTVVAAGMAGWQVTVIAVGAALFTATVAVLMDRARAARRSVRVSAA